MNRREAIAALPATAAACLAEIQAIKKPNASPETWERHKQLHEPLMQLSPDVPEDEDSGVHRAAVALLDFLDHADEVLTRHQLEEGGPCDCQWCYELRGQVYTIAGFRDMLYGEIRCGRLLHVRHKVHYERQERNQAARDAARAV